MTNHALKVLPPYFDALIDGSKPFEVRRNDRAFQTGDTVVLGEWHPRNGSSSLYCPFDGCDSHPTTPGHFATDKPTITATVTYVYAGDPRFTGLEAGHVVLGLELGRVSVGDVAKAHMRGRHNDVQREVLSRSHHEAEHDSEDARCTDECFETMTLCQACGSSWPCLELQAFNQAVRDAR